MDRDGDTARREQLDAIQDQLENPASFFFLAENAWEEIETWTLAGLEEFPARWLDIRKEIQVKEVFFEPLVADRGISVSPGKGRQILGSEAARYIPGIQQRCPEDFGDLAERLACWLHLS